MSPSFSLSFTSDGRPYVAQDCEPYLQFWLSELERTLWTLFTRRGGEHVSTAIENYARLTDQPVSEKLSRRLQKAIVELRNAGVLLVGKGEMSRYDKNMADDYLRFRPFQQMYPLISFEVTISDHERAMRALATLEVDAVLVFRPPFLPNFQPLLTIRQRLVALMSETHPLAEKAMLRLSECRQYPLALPERSIGGRQLLDEVTTRAGFTLNPAIQSNSFEFLRGCLARGEAISFQIEVGALPDHLAGSGVVRRPVDSRDLPEANLVLGQLRERNLPVAASMFCEHLKAALRALAPPDTAASPA